MSFHLDEIINHLSVVISVKDLQLITSCASVSSGAVSCGYGCGCEWECHQMCLELMFSAFNCSNILYCELDLGDERPTPCPPLHMCMEVHLMGETIGMESPQKSECCSVSNAPQTTYCNNGSKCSCEGLLYIMEY